MEPTVIVLAPLFNLLVEAATELMVVAGAGLTALVGKWVHAARVEARTHGLVREEQLMRWLDQGVHAGIGYAAELVRQYGLDHKQVRVRNRMVATAAEEAMRLVPKTLKELGYDRDQVRRLVLSYLDTPDDMPDDAVQERDANPSILAPSKAAADAVNQAILKQPG